ncbi:MAG: T9SS type A sorting domain-containing protein [Bacteroidales bacterium]|nr:T9SS type A sorting domain-containing protein [Bacteroidales bacterium]
MKSIHNKLKGSSIKEVNMHDISIYPNPANTQLSIDNGDIAMQELLLYDISGRLLKRVSVHANTTSLDVSDLQNGIYLIKITTPNATFVRKVQVVR